MPFPCPPAIQVLALGLALSASALISPCRAAQTLIPSGSVWKYLDDNSDQGTAWRATSFNDSIWASGPAQLGYGDGDEATVVSFGPNASSKYITTYFRHAFVVTDPELLTEALTVSLLRDDGAVVYLNGREVFRSNMPAGTITRATFASGTSSGAAESTFMDADLPPGDLVIGNNVVAVEVHQANLTSSDVSFDLRLSTSLGNPGANLTRQPYVQLVTPASAIVRWRTDAPVATVLRYGTNATRLTTAITNAALATDHSVSLSGLDPETGYYYSAETLTGILADGLDHYLVTAPPLGAPRPTRVWILGDSGRANASARSVRDAYAGFTLSRRTDVLLMLGDNAYEDGTDAEMQAAIYDQYAAFLRTTPLWPALGNHDTADSANPPPNLPHFVNWSLPMAGEAGGRPSGTEKYFSFDYGNIHFVCLDSVSSDRTASGPMANWLRQDLAQYGLDWIIVYFHHPPYSRGGSNSDTGAELIAMRTVFGPILEEGGADLVLAGHSHSYERSYLIDGHYGSSSTFTDSMKKDGGTGGPASPYFKLGAGSPHLGTVYVVLGSSAQTESGSLNHPAMAVSTSTLGSVVVDVVGGRLEARFLDSTGGVRDHFVMLKSFPEQVTITAHPQTQSVEPGETVTFTVRAASQHPIAYRWRKDGVPIPGATNAVLTISNVQESDQGFYDAVATDATRSVTSDAAHLGLRIAPTIVHPMVDMTVPEGGTFTLSIESRGTLPMSYRFRRNASTLTNMTLVSHQAFLTVTNAQPIDGGQYTVVLTNDVFYLPGVLSPRANIVIVPDTDRDGLPDDWETARGLNAADPSDAATDEDGDGLTLVEEYEAGTDPEDGSSRMRIEEIELDGGVRIEFLAVSNRTYTVQFKEEFGEAQWRRLADVVAAATNRVVGITDHPGEAGRFYRLRTPRRP